MKVIKKLKVFTDGGSRGNPGPSAIGVYMVNESDEEVAGFGKAIGIGTNNVAEYKAVIEALSWIIENKKNFSSDAKVYFYLDSKLVCSQITGVFKVKDANLRNLLLDVRDREGQINLPIFYNNIPREQNSKADTLVNKALDEAGRMF